MHYLRNAILAIAFMALTGGTLMGCGGSQKPAETPAPEAATDPCAGGDAVDEDAEEAMPDDEGSSLRGTDPCGGLPGDK